MFSIPVLVKVICIFVLILIFNRLRITLSLCMLLGAGILALWMKMPMMDLGSAVFHHLSNMQTISLVIIVGFILVISRLMKESGQLDRIVTCFSGLSGDDRTSGAVMASLIGLLPMPGGALFSAPMVGAALQNREISSEAKTAINYWFRHIWEYWWPLYPGVVLAVALLQISTWRFMAFLAPMTIVTVFAGYLFILKPLGRSSRSDKGKNSHVGIRALIWEIMPILVVIFVIMAQGGVIALLNLAGFSIVIPGAVSILPGLAVSIIWVCRVNHIPSVKIRAAVLDRNILPLIFLIAAIMIFKGILTDSRAVMEIQHELAGFGIPVVFVIMLIPFISGFITGIAIGFVGLSFPLIIPLFPESHTAAFSAHVILAYSFGYMGMMLSPVHLCFLVTKDHYKASLIRCYRFLIPAAVTVMICSWLIYVMIAIFNL